MLAVLAIEPRHVAEPSRAAGTGGRARDDRARDDRDHGERAAGVACCWCCHCVVLICLSLGLAMLALFCSAMWAAPRVGWAAVPVCVCLPVCCVLPGAVLMLIMCCMCCVCWNSVLRKLC